jgi:hypothetical protein
VNASGFAKISGAEIEGSITYDVYTHSSANTDAEAALWILANPEAFTESPPLPNTLRILVLVEASNTSFRLSVRVLLPEPKESAGKSYVIFGKTDTDAIDLTKLSGDLKYAID